jgi:hypothetical protein
MLMQVRGAAVSGTKQRHFTYSDEQWQAIKASLEHAGVDDVFFKKHRIRRRLEIVAHFFLKSSSARTPKQQADEMRKRLAAFKVVLDMLSDNDNFNWLNYYGDEDEGWNFGRSVGRRECARKDLTELISWTQTRIKQLNAMGRSSKHNARKRHVSFWRELTHLWHEFVVDAVNQPNKRLLSFLFACSQPVFPKATNDTKLIGFIERHVPHYVPQTSTISRASIAG